MSKISNWILEMQEDASWYSREVFIRKHGRAHSDVWYEVQRAIDEGGRDHYDELEMDDGA